MKNNLLLAGVLLVLAIPSLSSAQEPAAIKSLAVTACKYIKQLDYKSLSPYSNDKAKYKLNFYIKQISSMSEAHVNNSIKYMEAINCSTDTKIKSLGLDFYEASIKTVRTKYIMIMANGKAIITDFK